MIFFIILDSIITIMLFGQKIVSLFLFYSGYGINESFKKKDIIILKHFL